MAERMLKQLRDKVRISIVRPSIVIGTYEEPFPGWAENLAAGGVVNVTCGLGILRNVQCNPHQIIDCVPCDHVVNLVLAASSFAATQPNDKLYVYHSSSG